MLHSESVRIDAADSLTHLIAKFGFNPGSRYVDVALGKLANVPPKDFKELGIGSFVYAALFLTEGIGLWITKPWAEWFTTIITSSLVPLEVFELYRHPTATKVIVLILNISIVLYLILRIRQERVHNALRNQTDRVAKGNLVEQAGQMPTRAQ